MALALPISLGTLGTLITIITLSGQIIYGATNITSEGINSIRCKRSLALVERCSEIVEDLQQMDHHILKTGRSHRLVQTVVNSLNWASKYDNKWLLNKFMFGGRYDKKFYKCHEKLSLYFDDLVLSILLTRVFPDIPSPISSVENKVDENKVDENNFYNI